MLTSVNMAHTLTCVPRNWNNVITLVVSQTPLTTVASSGGDGY